MKQSFRERLSESLRIYWAFFKIGAVLFGGGYAILPFLQREFVQKRSWITEEDISDYFAVGQCTPGIIAVNTATFIGYKRQRIMGGVFATLGVITPSIVIITVIAAVLNNFLDIPWVQHAFAGIRVAVSALIVTAVIRFIKTGVTDVFSLLIFAASLACGLALDINPVFVVLAAAVLGLLFRRKAVRR